MTPVFVVAFVWPLLSAIGKLPMKSNLLATTQPSYFKAGMFSIGQPFLSLISLMVSVDVKHHVYWPAPPGHPAPMPSIKHQGTSQL